MTEQERISREALLRRAVALAGAAYVAPVVTSSATAEAAGCKGQACRSGKKGSRTCRRIGGKTCRCVTGRCWGGTGGDCGAVCCECFGHSPNFCSVSGECGRGPCYCCLCVTNIATGRCNCAALPSGLCADYPQCNPGGDGSDCPPGTCCMIIAGACYGICMAPCGAEVAS